MTTTLRVDGVKCQNCAGRVEKAVGLLAGVDRVMVDLAVKTVTFTYNTAQINLSYRGRNRRFGPWLRSG